MPLQTDNPSYVGFMEKLVRLYRNPLRNQILESYSSISSRVTSYLAGMEGILFHRTGREIHADQARRYLLILAGHHRLPGEQIREFGLYAAARAYACIVDSGCLNNTDRKKIENQLIYSGLKARESRLPIPNPPIPRVNNHCTFAMAGCEMIGHLFPDREETIRLRLFAEEIWNDWWAIRETPEVASHYEPFTQTSLFHIADLRGWTDIFFSDSIIKASFERNLQHLSPMGVLTTYGDGTWATSWGWWIAVFERAAVYYRDGRYKWAAKRILDYAYKQEFWKNANNSLKRSKLPLSTKHLLDADVLIASYGLALAADWEDNSLPEEVPKVLSGTTYRYLFSSGPPFKKGKRFQEKLILRAGWKKHDLYIAISLLKRAWHDQYDAGAILFLVCKGAMLLHETGVEWKTPIFHNVLLIRPEEENFLDPQVSASENSFASTEFLSEQSRTCFSKINSPMHQAYPIDHTRSIVMGKQNPIIGIWDTATVKNDPYYTRETHETIWGNKPDFAKSLTKIGRYLMGPIYHTQKIVSRGERYVDTLQKSIKSSDGNRFKNKPYHLLISFPLQAGLVNIGTPHLPSDYWANFSLDPSFIKIYEEGRTQYECVYQVAKGSRGDQKSFLSLLIPHAPNKASEEIIQKIDVLSSNVNSCCVQVGKITLLFNDGVQVTNDWLKTDAKRLYIEEKGKQKYIAFYQAKSIIFEGKEILSSVQPVDGEFFQ